jgi:hypothetical protein
VTRGVPRTAREPSGAAAPLVGHRPTWCGAWKCLLRRPFGRGVWQSLQPLPAGGQGTRVYGVSIRTLESTPFTRSTDGRSCRVEPTTE